MRRVTISYCDFRRGRMTKSEFIRDIPRENSVTGWQRAPQHAARDETSRSLNERLSRLSA
jgi:hypothetical protein